MNFSDALMVLVGQGHTLDEILNKRYQGCTYNGWPLLVFLHQLRAAMRHRERNRLIALDDIVVSNNISCKDSKELTKHRAELVARARDG